MSLRREIFIIVLIKLVIILALKFTFFSAPTVSNDREALGRQLLTTSERPESRGEFEP